MERYIKEEEFPLKLSLLRKLGCVRKHIRGRDRLLDLFFPGGRRLLFEVPFGPYRYRGDAQNEIDRSVLLYGAFSKAELAVLRNMAAYLGPICTKICFLDVGANVGHHALFMSKYVDEVLAFEPEPNLCSAAKQKVEQNGLDNTRVMQIALGCQNENRLFYPAMGSNMGTGSLVEGFNQNNRGDGILVAVHSGDDVLRALGGISCQIIKIDVEGFELEVLKGLRETLHCYRPMVLLELWKSKFGNFTTIEEFRSLIYPNAEIYRLRGRNNGEYCLTAYKIDEHETNTQVELVILPSEHARFVDNYSRWPWL